MGRINLGFNIDDTAKSLETLLWAVEHEGGARLSPMESSIGERRVRGDSLLPKRCFRGRWSSFDYRFVMTTRMTSLSKEVFGMASDTTGLLFDVSTLIGSGDAYEPSVGTQLATKVISEWNLGRVILDFSRVRIVTSAFSNAFFVTLGEARGFDRLPELVDFVNLRPRVADVWTRSYRAVRDTILPS